MLPQLGAGSLTPRPRNESVTSARMYCGTSSAAWVSTRPSVWGATWRRTRYEVGGPEAARGQHVVALARAQHDAAHEARGPRPVDEADDEHDHEEGLAAEHVQGEGTARTAKSR